MTHEKYSCRIDLESEVRWMQIDRQYTLKELRARKGKTQADTAKDLGISTQTYNSWEKDISNVAVSKVKAVADYFGVRLSEIFFN